MAELSHGTWVVVADSEKVLFLCNVTDAENPHLRVVETAAQDNPPDRLQGVSAPGRRADVGAGQRSAMEQTDWHELAKHRFAHDLAERLHALAHRGAFDRLVIVAGPQVMGALRGRLHKDVSARVVAEVGESLTHLPLVEIERHVMRALAGG
jgi:protein required for attachment to host cells